MRSLLYSLALLALLVSAAKAGDHGGKHGHSKVCCPACNYECQFTVEDTTVTKHYFEVECKPICIPPITFPWEKSKGAKGHGGGKGCDGKCGDGGDCNPGPRCGKVKVVKTLKKVSYECQRCKCKWTAVPLKGSVGGKAVDKAPMAASPRVARQEDRSDRAVGPVSSRRPTSRAPQLRTGAVHFAEEASGNTPVARTTHLKRITDFFKK